MKRPVVALVSPNKNTYSETFIQAHRQLLDADIRYLYGGYAPQFSEKYGALTGQNLFARIFRNLENIFLPRNLLTTHERTMADFFKKEKVDVVLAEYGVTGVKVCRACRAAGVPLIVHFHGFDAYAQDTLRRYASAYREMFAYASFIIGVSRHMCTQLKELGAPEEKLVYNTYGPNPAFFDIQPGFATKTFVMVGRLIPKKEPQTSIRAFARVAERFSEVRLRIGGDGSQLAACQELAQTLGIADKVEFAGPISVQQVQEWFATAFAFVQHSVTAPSGDTEGTPVVILEASAAGLPVIATRHAGIPDVIIEGETGFLVEEHDLDGFAEAMGRLAADVALAQKMGAANKQNIRIHFTMERHLEVLNALIRQAARFTPEQKS